MLNYRPDGVSEALTAIPLLLTKPGWEHSEHAASLRAGLITRLKDPGPHLRLLAVRSLPAVYVDRAELAAAISAIIDTEDNTHVLTQAVVVLDRFVPPELTDPVLASAGKRTAGPSITDLAACDDAENRDLCHWWVAAHLNCALPNATPHATAAVRSWFSDPAAAGSLFCTALPLLRRHVSFNADDEIRGSALDLFRTAASALRQGLTSAPADAPVVLAADTMATELYHASGAFEHKTPRPSARTMRPPIRNHMVTSKKPCRTWPVTTLSAARFFGLAAAARARRCRGGRQPARTSHYRVTAFASAGGGPCPVAADRPWMLL